MKLSVRTRLTLGNVGLLALALLAFGGATRFVVGRVLWGGLDQALVAQAERDAAMGPGRPSGPGGPDEGPAPPPLGDHRGKDGPPQRSLAFCCTHATGTLTTTTAATMRSGQPRAWSLHEQASPRLARERSADWHFAPTPCP
ncbi:MAG: hypothetical protein NTX57_04970 [Armatimonadetes bacterium]|nr:hypothetical protein [Armatimonadota bacterium]